MSQATHGEITRHAPFPRWLRRTIALVEVVAVLVGGALVARELYALFDFQTYKQVLGEGPTGEPVDFMYLSASTATNLATKYTVLFGLAAAIGWWRGKRSLRYYGLTTAGHRLSYLLGAGVVLFSFTLLPVGLQLLDRYVSLGAGAAHWWVMDEPWTASFWLFMAVSSFVLPPVLEEIFIRGYMQSRLVEDFGCAGGILLTATIFTLAHGQYLQLSVLSIGMVVSLFVISIASGYVFYRTGSLLPCIVGHALGNIPTSGIAERLTVAVMAAVLILAWQPIVRYAREFVGEFSRQRVAVQ